MSKLITVIDLGSNRIAAAAALVDRRGKFSIMGLESLASRGIEGGDVVDIRKAAEDIASIKKRLEGSVKRSIKHVFITARGHDIKLELSRGMVPLSRSIPREISKRDIKRCLEMASLIRIPLERTIIQNIVKGFDIDGRALGLRDPAGLYGLRLEAESFIATASRSKIDTITKCVDHAGLLLDGIYLSSMASAQGILDEEERVHGALLIDMGNSITESFLFKKGMLQSSVVITEGASNVLDGSLAVNKTGLRSLLEKIRKCLAGNERNFKSVVVTGGGALMEGVIEETERVFKKEVRAGIVKKAGRHMNPRDAIMHAPTAGLISHLAEEHKFSHSHKNPFHKVLRKALHIYETYF